MEPIVVWQQGSEGNSEANLQEIALWWSQLQGKEILWQQRPFSPDQDLDAINWESQKLDEVFTIVTPQIRGITLYWQKPTVPGERNLTPSLLKLDRQVQVLEVLPASTRNYAVRITVREPVYRKLVLQNPLVEQLATDSGKVLVFKDQENRVAIEVHLSDATAIELSALLQGG